MIWFTVAETMSSGELSQYSQELRDEPFDTNKGTRTQHFSVYFTSVDPDYSMIVVTIPLELL